MKTRNYIYQDSLFCINTISPNGDYYYKIQKPVSLNMSNFGTKIAFYNKNDELLYHCQNKWAHWIVSNNNDYDFVFWSDNNRAALFYEYKRNVSFEAILLDFDKNRTFRIDMAKFGYDLVSVFFEENFNLMNFMLLVSELKILEKPLIIEKFTSNIFSKWLPK